MKQNRFVQIKKKASKERYSISFRNSRPKVFCKKGVLKSFATCLFACYWNRNQVVDNNLSKAVKILISEKKSFFNILLWTSFVFCRSINKNMLEWFQLITSKEYTLTRSTNLFSTNHLTLCFCLKRKNQKMSLGGKIK